MNFSTCSEYEVCNDAYFTKEFCDQLPASQPCKCPIKAGEAQLKNVPFVVPDPGYLGYVMSVSYPSL